MLKTKEEKLQEQIRFWAFLGNFCLKHKVSRTPRTSENREQAGHGELCDLTEPLHLRTEVTIPHHPQVEGTAATLIPGPTLTQMAAPTHTRPSGTPCISTWRLATHRDPPATGYSPLPSWDPEGVGATLPPAPGPPSCFTSQ